MLTARAWDALAQVMDIGCRLKFFPYEWNRIKRRLNSNISVSHSIIFNFHGFVQLSMLIFSVVQLLLGLGDYTMPPRLRVMNLLWILAYIHGLQGFYELKYKRGGILCISNAVFDYIEEQISIVSGKNNL